MKKTTSVISVLLALLMIFSVTVSAAGGNGGGNGDGTGGGNGQSPLSFVSAKVGDIDLAGAELESSGAIAITFDRGMTDYQEANFEQIGIYNAQGTKAEGVTFSNFEKDDAGNSYTVLSYSGLAGGAYTLKLGKDLKANNGKTLGEDVTISFTVKTAPAQDQDGGSNPFSSFIKAIVNFFKNLIDFFKNLFK